MSDPTIFEGMENITEIARKNAVKVGTIFGVAILIFLVIFYVSKYFTREKMTDLVAPGCAENNLNMNSLNSDSPEIKTEYVTGEDIIETFYTPVPFNEEDIVAAAI